LCGSRFTSRDLDLQEKHLFWPGSYNTAFGYRQYGLVDFRKMCQIDQFSRFAQNLQFRVDEATENREPTSSQTPTPQSSLGGAA
jgi:hypothetical protein